MQQFQKLKSIVVRRLSEQHVIQKQLQTENKPFSFGVPSHGGWREMPPNLTF